MLSGGNGTICIIYIYILIAMFAKVGSVFSDYIIQILHGIA